MYFILLRVVLRYSIFLFGIYQVILINSKDIYLMLLNKIKNNGIISSCNTADRTGIKIDKIKVFYYKNQLF